VVQLLDVKEELCHHICFYLFYYYHIILADLSLLFSATFSIYIILFTITGQWSDAYLRSACSTCQPTLALPTGLYFRFACNI